MRLNCTTCPKSFLQSPVVLAFVSIAETSKMGFGGARGVGMGQRGQAISSALSRAIEQARKELVDPSRRNRLLHAPLSGKRPWCLAILGLDADEVFETLYRQDSFKGYSFAPSAVEEARPALASRPGSTEATRSPISI
jgi:hypothetical protein